MEENKIKKKVKIEEGKSENSNLDEAEETGELQMEADFIALHQQNYHHAGAKKGMKNYGGGGGGDGGGEALISKQKKKVKYKFVMSLSSSSRRCHYCKRSGKYKVVECNTCKTICYCLKCIRSWHPFKAEGSLFESCSVCRNSCNCKSCSEQLNGSKSRQDEKLHYTKYIIHTLLPLVKRFNEEQNLEKDIEANSQGLPVEEIKIQKAECIEDERINCNFCKTSIADFHRCCSYCSYELCLTCCKELRKVSFEAGEVMKPTIVVDGTVICEDDGDITFSDDGPCRTKKSRKVSKLSSIYRTMETGTIPCPGVDGHCRGTMQLKCIYPDNWVTGLYVKAEEIAKDHAFSSLPESVITMLNCNERNMFHKAASREDSEDNYLYCPTAKDIRRSDLKHFQRHLFKGDPMIINNVLEARRSVSWEPMVFWRACRETMLYMNVLDCMSWSQVKITPNHFVTGYREGRFYPYGWPQLLKSDDWPNLEMFEKRLPRHGAEYLGCLPFQEFTHPHSGYLNLVAKLPEKSRKSDLGQKTHIAYGFPQELGLGDSVTKLQCATTDVVYVLMHTEAVTLTADQLLAIHKRKEKLFAQGSKEFPRNKGRENFEVLKCSTVEMLGNADEAGNANSRRNHGRLTNMRGSLRSEILDRGQSKRRQKRTLSSSADIFQDWEDEGVGTLWDIFRRQDVPQLKEYLKLHCREFTHTRHSPIQQVFDPIRDQTFYLTVEHKRRLKEEYGIEPWTFTQKLGDAVVIPAGCPYQNRNLKSCVNVSLGFVSPENARESLHLTEELRSLPDNHIAKEDRLEVNKMILHAMSSAIEDFEKLSKLEADVLAEDSSSMDPASDAKGVNLQDIAGEAFCMSISQSDSKKDESLSTSSWNDQIDVKSFESTSQGVQSFSVPNQGSTSASKSAGDSCKNPSAISLAKEVWDDFINYPLKVFGNRGNEIATMHAISELVKNLPSFNEKEAKVLVEHYNIISSVLRERRNKVQLQQEMADLEESENLIDNLKNSEVSLKAQYDELERKKQDLEAKMQKIDEKMKEESEKALEIVLMAAGKRSRLETARRKVAKAESEIDSLISRSFAIRSQFRNQDLAHI